MEKGPILIETPKKPRLTLRATIGIWAVAIFAANLAVAGFINRQLSVFDGDGVEIGYPKISAQNPFKVSPNALGQKVLVWLGLKKEPAMHGAAPATENIEVKSIGEHLKEVVAVTPVVTVNWQGLKVGDQVVDTAYDGAGSFVGGTVKRLVDGKFQEFFVADGEPQPAFDAISDVKISPNQIHQAYLAITDDDVLIIEDGNLLETVGKVKQLQTELNTPDEGRDLLKQAAEGFLGYSPEGQLIYRGFATGTQFVVAGDKRLENVAQVKQPILNNQNELVGFVTNQVLGKSQIVDQVVSAEGISRAYQTIDSIVNVPGADKLGFIGELSGGKQVVVENVPSSSFADIKGLNLNSNGSDFAFLGETKEGWGIYKNSRLVNELKDLLPNDLQYDFASDSYQLGTRWGQLFEGKSGLKSLKELAPAQIIAKNPVTEAGFYLSSSGEVEVKQVVDSSGVWQKLKSFALNPNVDPRKLLNNSDELTFSAANRLAVPIKDQELGFAQMMSDDWLSPIFEDVGQPTFSPDGALLTYSAIAHSSAGDLRPSKVYLEDQLIAAFDKITKAPRFSADGKELIATGWLDGRMQELKMDVSLTPKVLEAYRQTQTAIKQSASTLNFGCDSNNFHTLETNNPILGNICAVRILNGQVEYLQSQAPYLKDIQRLDLSNNNLTTLPNYLIEFKKLRWLDLRGNQITDYSLLKHLSELEEVLY